MQSSPAANTASEFLPPRLLRLPMVIRITGLARSTIYRMIARQQFPGPLRIGQRCVAWRQIDIDEWIDGRPSTH